MNPMLSRRRKYRLAQRTLRYRVYVVIEALWAFVALIGIANEFRPTGIDWSLAVALATLAIAHSVKMTTVHPWLALKSILLGLVIFGVLAACRHYFGYPTSPLVVSAVIASAHYLWTGERWTTTQALKALEEKTNDIGAEA